MENQPNQRKKNKSKLVCFFFAVLAISVVFLIINYLIIESKKKRFELIEDTNLIYHIESVDYDKKELLINGWAFYLNVNADQQDLTIILRNIHDTTDVYYANEKKHVRPDINSYYDCEFDYSKCGFLAKVDIAEDVLMNGCYEILIKSAYDSVSRSTGEIRKMEKTISTHRYITKGELTSCRNDMYDPIITSGTYLDEVVTKGELLCYRREEGIYMYRYNGSLYWIANQNFKFAKEGKTCIQFELRTTKIDRIPKESLNIKKGTDNRDFIFEEFEYTQEELNQYRMAEYKIPTEYPIIYFWTGYYEDGVWEWRQCIH